MKDLKKYDVVINLDETGTDETESEDGLYYKVDDVEKIFKKNKKLLKEITDVR